MKLIWGVNGLTLMQLTFWLTRPVMFFGLPVKIVIYNVSSLVRCLEFFFIVYFLSIFLRRSRVWINSAPIVSLLQKKWREHYCWLSRQKVNKTSIRKARQNSTSRYQLDLEINRYLDIISPSETTKTWPENWFEIFLTFLTIFFNI